MTCYFWAQYFFRSYEWLKIYSERCKNDYVISFYIFRLHIALNSKPKAVIVNNFAPTNEEYEQVASESVIWKIVMINSSKIFR